MRKSAFAFAFTPWSIQSALFIQLALCGSKGRFTEIDGAPGQRPCPLPLIRAEDTVESSRLRAQVEFEDFAEAPFTRDVCGENRETHLGSFYVV